MLIQDQKPQKGTLQQSSSLKEEAARAVVRDAAARGYECVELGHDGRRPIFFCVHCGTRCYTDVSLWDHLKGNVHARRVSGGSDPMYLDHKPSTSNGTMVDVKDRTMVDGTIVDAKRGTTTRNLMDLKGGSTMKHGTMVEVKDKMKVVLPPPQLQLKMVDQGQVFLKVRPCSKLVEACWFEKRPFPQQQNLPNEAVYAIAVFPYSDRLGRMSIQQMRAAEKAAAAASTAIVEHKGRGRKRAKFFERTCFICRQPMVSGNEVATLLNVSSKQLGMMCHSRNFRGAFHVYHTCCLLNWILMYNSKQWMGQALTFRRQFRKNLKPEEHYHGSSSRPIFCPECQGTGVRPAAGQLERPRYRLSQIFEWILQLVQTRKLWGDHLGHETAGLMFHASKGIEHHRDYESSLVIPLGVIRLYSTMEPVLVESSKPEKMEIDIVPNVTTDVTTNVATDMDCA